MKKIVTGILLVLAALVIVAFLTSSCSKIPQQAAFDAGLLCNADSAAACLDGDGHPRLLGGWYGCATCDPAPIDRCPLDGVYSGVIEGDDGRQNYWVCVNDCAKCDP